MYHEVTYKELARRKRMHIILAIVVVFLCVNIAISLAISSEISRKQATSSVRESIVTAAIQCAAIEGSYPSSLSHLEQHYGLVINHNDYVVNYEWLADNIPPSVTVVPR